MKTAILAAAAGLACCASAAHASTAYNLIEDGNFLNNSPSFQEPSAGSALPEVNGDSSWYVGTGNVDLIGGYWQSPTGPNASAGGTNGSVDLDGDQAGSIYQQFYVPTTGQYTLQFYLAGNPDGGNQTVSVSTTEQDVPDPVYTFNTTGASRTNMNYQLETESFFANAGEDQLTFASNTPGAYGPVIGGVSVTAGAVSAAPEPSTWALMILGIGGIGFAFRQAKRKHGFRFKDAFAAQNRSIKA